MKKPTVSKSPKSKHPYFFIRIFRYLLFRKFINKKCAAGKFWNSNNRFYSKTCISDLFFDQLIQIYHKFSQFCGNNLDIFDMDVIRMMNFNSFKIVFKRDKITRIWQLNPWYGKSITTTFRLGMGSKKTVDIWYGKPSIRYEKCTLLTTSF